MMNQFFGVGRLVAQPEVKESENGKNILILLLLFKEAIKMLMVFMMLTFWM